MADVDVAQRLHARRDDIKASTQQLAHAAGQAPEIQNLKTLLVDSTTPEQQEQWQQLLQAGTKLVQDVVAHGETRKEAVTGNVAGMEATKTVVNRLANSGGWDLDHTTAATTEVKTVVGVTAAALQEQGKGLVGDVRETESAKDFIDKSKSMLSAIGNSEQVQQLLTQGQQALKVPAGAPGVLAEGTAVVAELMRCAQNPVDIDTQVVSEKVQQLVQSGSGVLRSALGDTTQTAALVSQALNNPQLLQAAQEGRNFASRVRNSEEFMAWLRANRELLDEMKAVAVPFLREQLLKVHIGSIGGSHDVTKGRFTTQIDYKLSNIAFAGLTIPVDQVHIRFTGTNTLTLEVGAFGARMDGCGWEYKQMTFPYLKDSGVANTIVKEGSATMSGCLKMGVPKDGTPEGSEEGKDEEDNDDSWVVLEPARGGAQTSSAEGTALEPATACDRPAEGAEVPPLNPATTCDGCATTGADESSIVAAEEVSLIDFGPTEDKADVVRRTCDAAEEPRERGAGAVDVLINKLDSTEEEKMERDVNAHAVRGPCDAGTTPVDEPREGAVAPTEVAASPPPTQNIANEVRKAPAEEEDNDFWSALLGETSVDPDGNVLPVEEVKPLIEGASVEVVGSVKPEVDTSVDEGAGMNAEPAEEEQEPRPLVEIGEVHISLGTLELTIGESYVSWIYNQLLYLFSEQLRIRVEAELTELVVRMSGQLARRLNSLLEKAWKTFQGKGAEVLARARPLAPVLGIPVTAALDPKVPADVTPAPHTVEVPLD